MLKEPTNEKLKALRLDAMAAAWQEQNGKPEIASLSFDERFGMLVDAEWAQLEHKRLPTASREVRPPPPSLVPDFERAEQDEPRLQAAEDALLLSARQNIGRLGVKEAQKAVRVEMFREAFRREKGNRHAVARLLRVDRRYVLKMLKENGGLNQMLGDGQREARAVQD